MFQFSGEFRPQSECDEHAQAMWMASLCGYARQMFEADGFVMDTSGMEYRGEMLLDDLMGDISIQYGNEQHQANVVSDSMRRALHDRDVAALPGTLQEGLAQLEAKMLDWERRWNEREDAKERERAARRQSSA